METTTIPGKLARRGNLVVIPQKEYEELLRIHKKHREFYEELDRDLDKAIKSYRKGKAIGPFTSVADLKKSLRK